MATPGHAELPYPGIGERMLPQVALSFLAPGSQVLFGGLGSRLYSLEVLGESLGEAC